MSIIKSFREIDTKFSWSFFGVIIGLLSVFIALYYENKPKLFVEIISNIQLFEFRENFPNLKIFYKDNEIDNKTSLLRIINFRITNRGNKSILISDYDQKAPFGITIKLKFPTEFP